MRREFMLSLCILSAGLLALADVAKVGVLVLDDETGLPMEGVPVTGYFRINSGWLAFKGGEPPNRDFASTDAEGRCRLRGKTNCGTMGVWVEDPPPGYYAPRRGWGGRRFDRKNLFGVWQPDNLVATVRLQRVGRPVPLFVKFCKLNVGRDIGGVNGGRFALDLLAGAWLPPFGTGLVADVEFTRHPREDRGVGVNGAGCRNASYRDAVMVRFPRAGDGLVESRPEAGRRLRVRTAPEDGYRPEWRCWRGVDGRLKEESNHDENRCFCFRVRTRRDGEGRIVEAYYGKIYGDFLVYTGRGGIVCGVTFSYYLNPTPLDRNLEWDRKTNLCPDRFASEGLP